MNRFKNWRDSMLIKGAVLLLLLLVLCIPLSQIEWVIHDRQSTEQAAVQELAQTYVGPQTLVGPVLVVPYVERWEVPGRNERGQPTELQPRSEQRYQLFFSQQSDLVGTLAPQMRYRGIFTVPFYQLQGQMQGRFAPFAPSQLVQQVRGSTIEVQTPALVLSVSDLRGLQGVPQLRMADAPLSFERRAPHIPAAGWLSSAVHAPLSGAALQAFNAGQALPFQLDLQLAGQDELALAPLADETTAHLTSPWPHPRFGGRFLATERRVSDAGFDAHWRIAGLTSQAREQVRASLGGDEGARSARGELDSFNVALAQPVSVYSMSERAAKYGALFIALVLLAVFTTELVKRLRLHPVQYALVGAALTLFFLLLLSLAEHLRFEQAYAVAATGCVLLLTYYASHILGSLRRGLPFGALMALLYGMLFILLQLEQMALVVGSLALFLVLAAVMVLTRELDWYALAKGAPARHRGAGLA